MTQKKRIHHKTCLLYDWNPALTKGIDEDRDCRCPASSDDRPTTIADWTAANVKARDAYHRHPNLDWCAWGDYHADEPPC